MVGGELPQPISISSVFPDSSPRTLTSSPLNHDLSRLTFALSQRSNQLYRPISIPGPITTCQPTEIPQVVIWRSLHLLRNLENPLLNPALLPVDRLRTEIIHRAGIQWGVLELRRDSREFQIVVCSPHHAMSCATANGF